MNENFINNNSNLVISYKGQEKEIILKNRIKYTNVNLDFTIIEMKKEDKINDYFEVDFYINSDNYLKRDIGILQYPKGNELSFDKGEVKLISNHRIIHTVSTDFGSSGSPIFLIENLRIIGIHNSRHKDMNAGIFMKNILNDLNSEQTKDKINKQLILNVPMILSSSSEKTNYNFIDYNSEEVLQCYFKCPVDSCMDQEDILYKHNACGTIQYINKKGEIICPKCHKKENFHNCLFECNYFNKKLSPSKDPQRIIVALAILGRLKSGGGKKFLRSLMDNLIDQCDSD